MRIDDSLHMLEVKAWGDGFLGLAALRGDDGSVALFDAGLPGSLPSLRACLDEAGLPFDAVDRVFVTHHDFDHIGGLPELLAAAAPRKVLVLAHAEEVPYVQGERPPVKTEPAVRARMQANLPEGQVLGPARPLENPPRIPVGTVLADGQRLDFAGGITAIHVPGHTPGHLCYYLHRSRVLVAGDALRAADGRLEPPAPEHSADVRLARASLAKLADLDLAAVVCYHGGCATGDLRARIRALAAR